MTKPTIVFIITKLELGGAQKVCLQLFNDLPQHGYHTHLISGTQGPLVKKVINKKNVTLLANLKREISLKNIFADIKVFFDLVRTLKQLKKQHKNIVVHTHSTKAGLLGRWAAWWAGVKNSVHTVHGYGFHAHQIWPVRFFIKFLEYLTAKITSRFVCVSSYDIQVGEKNFPYFKEKVALIRAAVDDIQFIPAKKLTYLEDTDKKFIFGTVACFKPQKNLFDLLRAFKIVCQQNPDVELHLIGDGILRKKIEQWIDQNNLSEKITLHGWQNSVAPIMHNWNAFVLTSLWEGLPCAIVEARMLKLPIISYKTGGIPDIIFNKKNGLLFEQRDWHNFAEGMLMLSHNKTLHQKLSAYHDELLPFKRETMIKRHADLYQQL